MKKPLNNDSDLLETINKMQALLIVLDKKVDTLLHRETKPAPSMPVNNDRHQERTVYKAICADCHKECTIPFKPSGDRPVYCQDCFSRRKVIRLSKMGVDNAPPAQAPAVPSVVKKKPVTAKKPVAKKKPTVKKK